MQMMKVRIQTKAPMILSAPGHTSVMTATQDSFSGSVLRGIFAARFIETAALGNAAHKDDGFMRLFYGGLRFVDAYPMEPLTQTRAIPLPLSVQRSKDGGAICDLMYGDAPRDGGFKSMRGFAAVCGKELHPVAVQKEIRLHISRSDLKSGSGEERLAGRSMDGGIYNYEAIAQGQSFEGMICGAEEELRLLCETIGTEAFSCYAGRSKYTQYGSCEITVMPVEDIPLPPIPTEERFCLRFETPFLPHRAVPGDARSMLAEVVAALNAGTSGGFLLAQERRSIYAQAEDIDNFVGVWGMRRPRETALGSGTVFAVRKTGGWQPGDMAAVNTILCGGVGRRTEEGFGQLRIWDGTGLCCIEQNPPALAARELCAESRRIAEQIILAHIIEQIRVLAAEDAGRARRTFPPDAAHAFARLDSVLGARPQAACERMRELILDTKKEMPLGKMLEKVKIEGRPLRSYLEEVIHEEMPYAARERQNITADQDLIDAGKEVGVWGGVTSLLKREEVFYAYWHTFFRFARKTAGQTEKGGASA